MFDLELANIARITERVVGLSHNGTDIYGWTEYDCPYCCDREHVDHDGKHNCCINYQEGYFHCWKCGAAGKISRLIKDYGGDSLLSEYYDEIRSIRDSQEYRLYQNNSLVKSEHIENENVIDLPSNFRRITKNDPESEEAYTYLSKRGLDYDIINDFCIGYVPWSEDYRMRCRIVVPSYDRYMNLNYYVSRDYTGKQKLKYVNPNTDKKEVVFNEGRINWCENVTLVEGVFDSFPIQNSIPLLGKSLNDEFAVYSEITNRARANVNILLDDDAVDDAKKMYLFLNSGTLRGRVRVIECPKGYDAADYYRDFGKRGVLELMRSARKLKDNELF